ncbi:nuclear transport factor 2 family protein [Plantactinospora sp. GCM10030261]|uniref:nuclear transport factor 2 family protein n=1 Tax=Plantactinospora sp. GCM10030261 TaxID=3273420 RepID=UPI0036113EBE
MSRNDHVYEETIAAWRMAGERGDAPAAVQCLAEEVEVISPLTAQFRFRGRTEVGDMLAAAFEVIHDIRFHTSVGTGDTRALFYRARTGREEVEEAQLVRLDAAGQIREITLFGRPLPALTAVMAEIGPRLLRRQSRPGLARMIGMATRPLAVLTRLGEHRMVPMAAPPSARAGRPGDR